MTAAAPRRARRGWRVAVVVAAVAAVVVAVIAGIAAARPSGQGKGGSSEGTSAAIVTAAVERRVLAEEAAADGIVEAEFTTAVAVAPAAPSGYVPVVTATPKRQGDQVSEGDALVEISTRPVVVLLGAIPAFRDIGPGTAGGDVLQLQQALVRLRMLRGRDATGVFGEPTTAAVARLFARHRAAAAPDGVVRRAEIAFVPALPAEVAQLAAAVGSAASDLTVTVVSGGRRVTAHVPPGLDVSEGERVTISAGGAPPAEATVTAVGPSTPESSTAPAAPRPVVVTPAAALDLRVGAAVVVTFRRQVSAEAVLAVPAAAVTDRADGSSMVTVVGVAGSRRAVRVEPGASVGGFVAVTGDGLAEGDEVLLG